MSVERQQGRAYQGDLFDEALLKALRPDASGDGGTEPAAGEESQALAALAQQRNRLYRRRTALFNDNRRVVAASHDGAAKRRRPAVECAPADREQRAEAPLVTVRAPFGQRIYDSFKR